MTTTESWTVLRLLQWTEQYLRERDFETPRLDAEVLLATARGCDRIQLYTSFDEIASEATRAAFRELVRRRAEGTPVAYLVGYREFFSRRFRVTPDVLIPRPETEFLVVELLDRVGPRLNDPYRIADVGTGSGILAVCAALELPAARVTAIDHSRRALEIAEQNAIEHGVSQRVHCLLGDLLSGTGDSRTGDSGTEDQTAFDFILSNPPYVSTAEYAELDPQVRDHEPRDSLVAGATGTEIIERLIPQAAELLVSGGWLLLEISPMIESRVHQLLHDDGRFTSVSTTKDLAQLARVVAAQRTANDAPTDS